jgi:pimeloyl-ACP methyl ester carboxylesterase
MPREGERGAARRLAVEPELFGALAAPARTVLSSDGVPLHVEVDEPDERAGAATVVFVHGYCLNLHCWHFQRRALRGRHRLVLYDQRSHGRSGRSAEPAGFDQLGRDLHRVIQSTAPTGPVVLVGHSMGGMVVMALAEQHPELFGGRVAAVALLATSAGDLRFASVGLPGVPGQLVQLTAPAVLAVSARVPALFESARRVSAGLGYALTRRLAFGAAVPAAYVDFVHGMLASTPVSTMAEFFPGFSTHRKYAALAPLREAPVLLVGGTRDRIIPLRHIRKLAELLPSATLRIEVGAGHLVMLERHREVNRALAELLAGATPGGPP